ncbi:MAG TPA: hypothetical protein DF296_12690 [Candidatus Margulisbacteria bacterium]|nr:MAG: hypothetical protein A2X41_10570 [Candidatus Margulisbacteria bacterium GWE2_39_32]HCT86040.1 hypothetical protein [Candidatus Margulisiibacteriota bacterium]
MKKKLIADSQEQIENTPFYRWINTAILCKGLDQLNASAILNTEALALARQDLQLFLAIISKYNADTIIKTGIICLSENINKSEAKKYSHIWSFDEKNKESMIAVTQWLIIKTSENNLSFVGKHGESGTGYQSMPDDNGKEYYTVIPPLKDPGHYWLTFKWSGTKWEGNDYHIRVLPDYRSFKQSLYTDKGLPCHRLYPHEVQDFDEVALTNGRGALCNIPVGRTDNNPINSKYNGILLINNHPEYPIDRDVLVSFSTDKIIADNKVYDLNKSTLKQFERYPTARWIYQINEGTTHIEIEKTLQMHYGKNTTIASYKLLSASIPIQLIVRPALEQRSYHGETKAGSTGLEKKYFDGTKLVTVGQSQSFHFNGENWQDFPGLTIVSSDGTCIQEPYWHYNVFHPTEAARGQLCSGDKYSPGYIVFQCDQSKPAHHIAYTCEKDARFYSGKNIETVLANEQQRLEGIVKKLDPKLKNDSLAQSLVIALDQFITKREEHKTVIAGYPWFIDWGRDTLLVLRGIIEAELLETSEDIIKEFAKFEENGTLPNIIHGKNAENRDTVDAQLVFAIAVNDYIKKTGNSSILEEVIDGKGRNIKDVIKSIAANYIAGTENGIHMDRETGLIWSPTHFTWMDTNHPAGTPREGYPVEIQVFWYHLLTFMTDQGIHDYTDLATKVKNNFQELYWNGTYLYDNIEATNDTSALNGKKDSAIRPNMLFAVLFGLIAGKKAESVITVTREQLIIPGFIRSLSENTCSTPDFPYQGRYEGGEDEKRKLAYHNGTGWSWLYYTWIDAMIESKGMSKEALEDAHTYFEPLREQLNHGGIGSIAEVCDGDYPHTERGCNMQAWGISEALRVYIKISKGLSTQC